MNTPNPLVPQGSLQQHQSRGKSTVRIAVFSIIAIHAVFFTGLLMQGCGPDKTAGKKAEPTNNLANELPKLDTNAGYYSSFQDIPAVATNLPSTNETLSQRTSPPPASVPSFPAPARETPAETKEYTIARGDSLYKIAKAHGVTIAAITKANPGIDPAKIRPGKKIQIPLASPASPGIGSTEPGPSETGNGATHVVKAGETLTSIAKQHGTTPKAIKAANNLKTDQLLVGKKLKLPAPSGSSKTNKPAAGSSASSTNPNAVLPLRTGSTATNLQ